MKALVTGGTGFLGSHLVEALLKRNFSVRCLVRDPEKLKWLKGLAVEIAAGCCSDKDSLARAVSGADYVFHCAGLVRDFRSDGLYQTNVKGTKNLIEAVCENDPDVKRFVYVSSQAAAGPSNCAEPPSEDASAGPVSHYGFSKFLGEKEILKFCARLPVTVLRPPAIYGPRDRDVFVFFMLAEKGFLPIPKEEKFVNISFVSDIVDGIISAALSPFTCGGTYFIGDDIVFSWRSLVDTIRKTVNPGAKIIKIPRFVFGMLPFFSEFFSKFTGKPALLSADKLSEMKRKYWLCSVRKAKTDFGYSPKISLEEGLKITYNWYKKAGWL